MVRRASVPVRRPDPPRVVWRKQMRERVLAEARALAGATGWDAVRVADLAERAQVSRPWIYKEFGDRAGIGAALVRRESEDFLIGVAAALDQHPDSVAAAVEAGVRHALAEAARNPFIHAVVTASRGGTDGLLPFLTARPEPVFTLAGQLLRAWLAERLPAWDEHRLEEAGDLVVRLTVSHILLPAADAQCTPERIARAVVAVLGAGVP
ncbi:TetR family transcriptional regulator [Actinocrinis puniceicyclus]|uniref:TetR family transcriptional regulator n=1 Tax=Actinocrinis puniceicyclus TaxID=977794 RepID=A0A8J7WN32_9ACTN|nr:TetR family transcriptional regulator [Actinocrinis puniceicyclus]MBS2965398.1 TetR family transcriptional regulator [Actinocrinis puniceicyclus]